MNFLGSTSIASLPVVEEGNSSLPGGAFYSSPEIFQDGDIRSARNLIRRLVRAQYIKKSSNPNVYSGGSPGLGKRR
jgi:hypothetical protein